MEEFERINKKSLLKNIFERPRFYWALAHDMNFFRHPKFFLNYLGDYAAQ